ncbi:MAG: MFS transporter [bacterium]
MTEPASFIPDNLQLARLKRWRVSTFWVMLIGYIGYYLVRGNLPVALPFLSQEFGYTNTQLGIILTFSELAYALGKFTTGPLADRIGGRRIFLLGMWGAIAFNFVFPVNPGMVFFTVVACCIRYFLSMGWGGIIKTIGKWYEPERNGTIMGLISINFQFGGVAAALFGGLLIAMGSGWTGLFIWPAAAVTVIAVLSHMASKESPQSLYPGVRFGRNAGQKKAVIDFRSGEGTPAVSAIIRRLLAAPLFRQVIVFSFVTHILRSFFMVWVPKFMVDMGMGNVNAALTSAVFPLMGCIGTIALGWYTDRYAVGGDRASAMWKMLLGLVFSLAAIALLIPHSHDSRTAIVVMLGLCGLFLYGPYSMSSGCLTLDIAGPEGAGTCTGMIDGIGYIGGALAAWGAGFMADMFGWTEVFWILTGCAFFIAAWTFYMSWASRRATAAISPANTGGGTVLAAIFLAVIGLGACSSLPVPRRDFEVQGHRGARAVRPENTMSAFKYALGTGVDTLEMDLKVTKDGVLVVMHDPFVRPERCLDARGRRPEMSVPVRSLTLDELKTYDCGSLPNPQFPSQVPSPGEKIPSFEEILDWLDRETDPRAGKVLLNVETKSEEAHPEYAPPPDAFARLVLEALKKHGMLERTTLQSFDFRTLTAARALEPGLTISALIGERPQEPLAAIASRLKADIISPNHRWLTERDVESLHAIGVRVIPWTANNERDWRRLIRLSVDGIISDDPLALLQFRQRLFKKP